MTVPAITAWPAAGARAVELSTDPRFTARVRRLAIVSVLALGWLVFLTSETVDAPPWVAAILATGWLTMPLNLAVSIRVPLLRYALFVPSTLVVLAVGSIVAVALPGGIAGAGWVTLLAGLAVGSWLGAWFWMRALPVPEVLDAPFSPARLWLIRVHVSLVIAGMAMASVGSL